MLSNRLIEYAEKKYAERLPYLKTVQAGLEEGFSRCTPEEAALMRFFYGTMPLRDAGEYDFQVFLSFVRHGLWLRGNVAWCADLPEDIFVNHVLYYRINSEDISENRAFFYEQLKDRLTGKALWESPCQAVIEINYWCAEHAAYQASDMRTASPMTVYRSGKGRCGEESTFLVTALRSVGIPARQVYTPRWAHCDDNHAWVEVWAEGRWHFLGACEPEEVLNKGWFSHASSRALLVHSRNFSDFTGEEAEECIGREGVTWFYNNTSSYARTRRLTVAVKDREGRAVKDALVSFEILNMGEYCSVASLAADEKGEVRLTAGLGDFHVRAQADGYFGEQIVSGARQERAEIVLSAAAAKDDWIRDVWEPREIAAPEDYPMNPGIVTPEQKQRKRQRLARANKMREERIRSFYREDAAARHPEEKELLRMAAGNFDEVLRFLEKDENPHRKALLHSLSAKDYLDVKAEVLEDALCGAQKVRGVWPEEFYQEYLLCPRIYYEELTAYHSFIDGYFTEAEKERFREDPEKLWAYIEAEIHYEPALDYRTICATPVGCLTLMQGNETARKILFVAVCRTLGIPARLNRVTAEPEYYAGTRFRTPGKAGAGEEKAYAGGEKTDAGTQKPSASLELQVEDGSKWIYYQTWTIGKLAGLQFVTLDYEGLRFGGNCLELTLDPGIYRLITTSRMPNGSQHAAERTFRLAGGDHREISMSLREGSMEDMLVSNELPEFEVTDADGKRCPAAQLTEGGSAVLCFLEEGAEPTEHVLNELMQQAGDWNEAEAKLVFIVRDAGALSNATLARTLEKIPRVSVYFDPEGETAEPIARRMYVDPEKLPLLVVTKDGMTGIYASSGYNVGSVDLMLKILRR